MARNSKAVRYKDLKELAGNGQLLSGFKINQSTTIIDGVKFLDSHLSFLDSVMLKLKNGEKVKKTIWMPAYDRLIDCYFGINKLNK